MDQSLLTSVFMSLLSMIMVILILYGFNLILTKTHFDAKKKVRLFFVALILITVWISLISILSLEGYLSHFEKLPPRPVFLIIFPLPFILWFAFSNTFRQLIVLTPKTWLIHIQVFRVVVELILWMMFLAGQLPVQMTFEGSNLDILAGLTAIPIAYFCFSGKGNRRVLAIIWNIFGLLLLMNILVIAVLSMPTPLRYFMNEPANTIVAIFPYVLLPGVLVIVAYSMHIFSLRQLFLEKESG